MLAGVCPLTRRFLSVGMCDEAVESYRRGGDPKAAVDACVLLHKWDRALELAQEHSIDQVRHLRAAALPSFPLPVLTLTCCCCHCCRSTP